MTDVRQVVCVARTSFAGAVAEGRFPPLGVVREGQLLMETDPIVQATRTHWTRVGTADATTAQLITDLGPLATLSDLLPRLGPLPDETREAPGVLPPMERIVPPELTKEAIEAERARLVALDLPHGYDTLAKNLVSTSSTIRRRLGTLK